jgi:hypothetical protein
VLRVLLEKPKPWTLTEIANELKAETGWIARELITKQIRFAISLGYLKSSLQSRQATLGAAARLIRGRSRAAPPAVYVDRVDVFLLSKQDDGKLRQLDKRPTPEGVPRLRFMYPYDEGVFLYARNEASLPQVSNIQAYLDPYARGRRDFKQADYLLEKAIAPRWKAV